MTVCIRDDCDRTLEASFAVLLQSSFVCFFSFLSFRLTQGQIGKVNAAFWSTQWNHTSHIRPQVHIKECYPLVFSCLTHV